MDLTRKKMLAAVQKPGRYTGGELNSVMKDKSQVKIRFAFCFPDTYEIGMSHLGMKILYSLFNEREDTWCERVFAPWLDMEQQMRQNDVKLYALESGDPIDQFDFIGFTLQYELSYSNVLYMLDLGGIPLLAADRKETDPFVMVGGPCAYNCEPLADFVDLVMLGEGEITNPPVFDLYNEWKGSGKSRMDFLKAAAQLPGVYVPCLYDVTYHADGTVQSILPNCPEAPKTVTKQLVQNLDEAYYPSTFVVPSIEIVHDRVMLEIFRGCTRGCRFCQAGMIYRPQREKDPHKLSEKANELFCGTGYDEISLSSLSTSDYTRLEPLLDELLDWTVQKQVSLALPSLRVDHFSPSVVEKIQKVRQTGLTCAPEAGTQRLRDAINKNVTEEDIRVMARTAFEAGYQAVKLYVMIGLPTETMEDIAGINDMAKSVVDEFYACPTRNRQRPVRVTVSAASFVPKPFTPFQWEAQDTPELLAKKQQHLRETARCKQVSLSWHDIPTSFLEGVFARGDRRLSKVLLEAYHRGCKFDAWDEQFHFDWWMEAFVACNLDPAFYANRVRTYAEVLPWDHIDIGVKKEFLWNERQKAYASAITPHCREQCSNCGILALMEGGCPACKK